MVLRFLCQDPRGVDVASCFRLSPWHPSWLGTRQARNFTLESDILSVRTDESSHPSIDPGRPLSFILSWQREA